MKISNILFLLFALGLVGLVGCDSDDDNNNSGNVTLASGEITLANVESGQTLTLSANGSFDLTQALRVKDGGILVIEEGATITAKTSNNVNEASLFLVVEQGGTINAVGTASAPIVMTAETKSAGAWGGLIICGKAPINLSGGTGTIEIGDAAYGGTEPDDNSGTIKYFRVEYTGSAIGNTKEHNGISFYGVGRGTTVEYVQSYIGNDDGMEWYGGTVNGKYLVVSGSGDDCFDWTDGWTGTITDAYAIQDTNSNGRLIEADNLEDNNGADPFSDPTWTNVTLVGSGKDTEGGVELRRGTKGSFTNFLIKDVPNSQALRVSDSLTGVHVANGDLEVTNFKAENVGTNYKLKGIGFFTASDSAKIGDAFGTTATGTDFASWKGTWVRDL